MKKLLFSILLLGIFITDVNAATQLLKTVKPSGGDYTSLEACMNANEQNLVTADKYLDVEIDGTWSADDTTGVTIENYTTDTTHYWYIYTTSTARHTGTANTGYTLYPSTSVNSINITSSNFGRIMGLNIKINKSAFSANVSGIVNSNSYNSGNYQIAYNLFSAPGSDGSYTNVAGIRGGFESSATFNIWNNFFINIDGSDNSGTSGYGINISNYGGGTKNVYSNTILGSNGQGITLSNGTQTIKNNICNGNGTDYGGTFTTSSNNISEDATSPDVAYRSKAVTFVSETAGSEDLHLASTDTNAIDAGTDTSGEGSPLNFTDDIDGVARSGTWDIGADEFVSGVVTIPSLIINGTVFIQNMIVQ